MVFNSLRNSGEFERRLKEIGGLKCPESAPRAPVYGFDDEEEVKRRRVDGLIGIVRVLRQRLPIRDRILRMKMVRNCFSGSEMVEGIILQMDCGRKKVCFFGNFFICWGCFLLDLVIVLRVFALQYLKVSLS